MSPSEVHHAIHRGVEAHLVEVVEHRNLAHEKRVNRAALLELCLTGLKYVFPGAPPVARPGNAHRLGRPHAAGDRRPPRGAPAGLAHRGRPGGRPGGATLVPVRPRTWPGRTPTFYAMMAAVDALRTRCPRASRAAEVTLISLLGTPRAVPAPPRQAVLQ
jgi:hypothetical protein